MILHFLLFINSLTDGLIKLKFDKMLYAHKISMFQHFMAKNVKNAGKSVMSETVKLPPLDKYISLHWLR